MYISIPLSELNEAIKKKNQKLWHFLKNGKQIGN
jgi:hypothetical protein